MAISREGSNLPNRYFIPEIFAKEVDIQFKKEAVANAIINRTYEGEIKKAGDTVYIRKIGTLSLRDISVGSKTEWSDLEDDRITLSIDVAKELAFKIEDIDQAQSDIKNIMALYSEEGSYAVSDDFDQYILGLHANAKSANQYGTTGTPIDVGFDTDEVSPTNVITRMGRLLDEQNVPSKGRWMVIPPLFKEQLLQDSSVYAQADKMGANISPLTNGALGKNIGGFDLYLSNNVATDSTYYACMCGTKAAIAGAQQITKTEKLRLQDSWADGIRMMSVYGAKVVKPEALGVAYCRFD